MHPGGGCAGCASGPGHGRPRGPQVLHDGPLAAGGIDRDDGPVQDQTLEQVGEHEFDADVVARIGPVKARFRTRIEVSNLDPPESYTLSGEGRGGAAGFASGSADVSLEAVDGETVLRYAARLRPGGRIAQVGSRLVGGTVRKIGADFFSRFVEVVTPDPPSEEGEPADQEE